MCLVHSKSISIFLKKIHNFIILPDSYYFVLWCVLVHCMYTTYIENHDNILFWLFYCSDLSVWTMQEISNQNNLFNKNEIFFTNALFKFMEKKLRWLVPSKIHYKLLRFFIPDVKVPPFHTLFTLLGCYVCDPSQK